MKKLICMLCALSLCAAMFAACSKDDSSSSSSADTSASTSQSADTSSEETSSSETSSESEDTAAEADTEKLESIVASLKEVNPISNPRAITSDDIEFYMNMTPDNLVDFRGDITNTQSDCGIVFVAQVKDGSMDAVVEELEAFRDSMSSSLYAEFADKVAKAQDARIVSKDNIVVLVVASIDGPDYADIDAAIDSALA